MENSVSQHGYHESDSLRYTQPMQTDECIGDVNGAPEVEDEPCRSVQS